METIRGSLPRPPRDDDPLAAPALNDGEERALEAIRRQLDIDFPLGVDDPPPVPPSPASRGRSGPRPGARRPRRSIRIGAALGGLFLAACAAVGGAAVGYVVQYVRTADSRAAANRDALEPTPRTTVTRLAPIAPSAPAREIVGPRRAAGPTPERIAPTPLASAPPASAPAPAPTDAREIVLPPRRPSPEVSAALVEPKPAPAPAAGHPSAFFYAGQYYKRVDGSWLVSNERDGPWTPVSEDRVPSALLGLPGVADVGAAQASESVTSP